MLLVVPNCSFPYPSATQKTGIHMVFSSEMRPIGIFLRIHMLEHASKNPAENPAESIAKTQRNPLEKPSGKNGSQPVKTCENL